MIKILLLSMTIFLLGTLKSQEVVKLNVGDKAPNLVLPTVLNTVQSFNFPHNNKVVLLVFWSSSVSNSKENLFKYGILSSKYDKLQYKNSEGFEVIPVAIQSDRILWENDVKKYHIDKLTNCIALKGYRDFFIKSYHLTETPASFLIDEFGNINAVNPDLKTILSYLEEKKNNLSIPTNNNLEALSTEVQYSFSGKILFGEDSFKPLANTKLYITDNNHDTIESVATDENGVFFAKSPKAKSDINIEIGSTDLKEDDKLFLANESGNIYSRFNYLNNQFSVKLFNLELVFFKNTKLPETKSSGSIEITDLYVYNVLFNSGITDLSLESKKKLEKLIEKLKQNPKTKIQIISHTDCKRDSKTNIDISLVRSKNIVNYFISKGVQKTRIETIEKGETEFIKKCEDCKNCLGDQVNNRTEFKFYRTE
jgi:outer membrane protein OmpA-like peptidoglycan-associated protein